MGKKDLSTLSPEQIKSLAMQVNMNPQQDIAAQFASMQSKNEMVEVLKELFDAKKVNMTTELSYNQIKIATRIRMVARLKNLPLYDYGLDTFMGFMLSHKRKSREEIIKALNGYNQQKSMFNPTSWFGRGNKL